MKKKYLVFLFIMLVSLMYSNTLNDLIVNNKIDNAIRLNKWEDAKSELELYLKNNSTDSYAYSIYAAVLNQLKKYDDAIIAVRTAINYEKSNEIKGNLYSDLGDYYYNKGLMDIALEMYKKSLEYNSMIDKSYYMMGTISYNTKDDDNAIRYWKKYIEITTNAPKREKLKKILDLYEKQIIAKKLKEEEEKRLKEEFLKKLNDELSKDNADTKSLGTDKDKTKKSEEDYEEID